MITAFFVLALLQVKIPDAQQIVGSPQGAPLSGATLEKRTIEVSALLRCPVCQGMSVADSPSTVAIDMKHQVRDLLARGYTQKQILDYFETSYGQFVLLKPKFGGFAGLVWVLPVLVLVIGAAIVFMKMRKLEALPPAPAKDAATDPYLDQVRKLVDSE